MQEEVGDENTICGLMHARTCFTLPTLHPHIPPCSTQCHLQYYPKTCLDHETATQARVPPLRRTATQGGSLVSDPDFNEHKCSDIGETRYRYFRVLYGQLVLAPPHLEDYAEHWAGLQRVPSRTNGSFKWIKNFVHFCRSLRGLGG